jgi:gas vesicle protein
MAYHDNQDQTHSALTGLVIGAVVGFAAAIFLDKDKRQAMVQKATDFKDQASDAIQEKADDWGDKGHDLLNRLEEAIDGLKSNNKKNR